MFGKWHLGYCSKKYTPLGRGFDTFQGRCLAIRKEEPYNVQTKINKKKLHNHKKQQKKKNRFSKFCMKKEKNARQLKRKKSREYQRIHRKLKPNKKNHQERNVLLSSKKEKKA